MPVAQACPGSDTVDLGHDVFSLVHHDKQSQAALVHNKTSVETQFLQTFRPYVLVVTTEQREYQTLLRETRARDSSKLPRRPPDKAKPETMSDWFVLGFAVLMSFTRFSCVGGGSAETGE